MFKNKLLIALHIIVECDLVGINKLNKSSLSKLIGDLAMCYHEQTDGFIRLATNPIFSQIQNCARSKQFFANQKLIALTEEIFNKHQVEIENKVIKSSEQKGRAFKPNAKVLLFSNPFVSSEKIFEDIHI